MPIQPSTDQPTISRGSRIIYGVLVLGTMAAVVALAHTGRISTDSIVIVSALIVVFAGQSQGPRLIQKLRDKVSGA